jgi:hypothetical protein
MSNDLKTLLSAIAENPRIKVYTRLSTDCAWSEFAAAIVLELIATKKHKFMQCAIKKPNPCQQKEVQIPPPEKSLSMGMSYYVASPDELLIADNGLCSRNYKGSPVERVLIANGLVYRNREAAIRRAKAMLQYSEVEYEIKDADIMTFYGTEFD